MKAREQEVKLRFAPEIAELVRAWARSRGVTLPALLREQAMKGLADHLAPTPEPTPRKVFVSDRSPEFRKQVVNLVAEGLTDREIAERTGSTTRIIARRRQAAGIHYANGKPSQDLKEELAHAIAS